MYTWVRPCIEILVLCILIYCIYHLTLPLPEGFITATPRQTYAIPELRGVQGRFVRIRPSITHGDGYLTISQIQVIDINGNNVALNAQVFATSSGGSSIDQQYGSEVPDGNSVTLTYGVSADPSCVTDGVLIPRRSLVRVFETENQNYSPANTSAADTEYLEIDLSAEFLIKKVIYSGRADPLMKSFRSFQGIDTLDQVSRLKNMRLEIRSGSKELVLGGDGAEKLFSDDPSTHVTTIEIETPLVTLNKGSSASGVGATEVFIPDIKLYTEFVKPFTLYPTLNNLANKDFIDKINLEYAPINLTQSSNGLGYIFDVNTGIYSALLRDSPINFYIDMYSLVCPNSGSYCKANDNCVDPANTETCGNTLAPGDGVSLISRQTPLPEVNGVRPVSISGTGRGLTLPPPPTDLRIQIFGNNVDAAAVTQMNTSINLCKKLYLGLPELIENYIRVQYATDSNNIKAYLRKNSSKRMCMPDIRQVFQDGGYTTRLLTQTTPTKSAYQTWNEANCDTLIDGTLLALLPAPTRNFVIEWIYNRTIRYVHYKNIQEFSGPNPRQGKTLAEADDYDFARVSKMKPTTPPIDIASATVLNSVAQQFYELLGGQFAMSYIYDVFPLGTTMLDIRFDLIIHTDDAVAYGPIAALKAQYKNFRNSGSKTFTQDILDQANIDYQDNLQQRETDAIESVSNTFQGAVVRVFYTPGTPTPILTGMIFDDRAVTSFLPMLNGGIIVPIGSLPGNVNYTPDIVYTKNNPQEKLVCSDPDTVRRVMDDYMNVVQSDTKILLNAVNPIDTSKGTLFVNEVHSYRQISPTQCAYEWIESLYDPNTNRPVPLGLNGSVRDVPITSVNYVAELCGADNVKRFGIFTYKIDKENWSSPSLDYDPTSFKLLSSNEIPRCSFDAMAYKNSLGVRFSSLGSSTADITRLRDEFMRNTFNNGTGPVCPQTIPGYLFNEADYLAANGDVAAAGVNALDHYKVAGFGEGRPIRSATRLTPFPAQIKYVKPIPAQSTLDTSSGLCPVSYCEDLDILYTLADQYNSNPSFPGSILRIKRAFTVNPYQCDVEAEINYDAMIQNTTGYQTIDPMTGIPRMIYPMIKKGTVTYTQGVGSMRKVSTQGSKSVTQTGIKTEKIALSVSIDKGNCDYLLVDVGEPDSGASIRENTPMLYKPMNYVEKLSQVGSSMGSSISQIQSDFSVIGSSAKNAIVKYRANTYSAIGDINTLTICPGAKCSDPGIMSSLRAIILYELSSVLFVGTANGTSCDLTYVNTSNQTVAKRFTMANLSSGCKPMTHVPIIPTPNYNDIRNMGSTVNTANTYKVSGFTDYVPPLTEEAGPLRDKSFGLDRARNSVDAYTEIQFQPPLEQSLPQKEIIDRATYRFLRFVPLKTREPKGRSIRVNKFTFFYEGSPVAIEARVTNPMGTWEGDLGDVAGAGFRKGWVDDHKKPLVFAFKAPILVDGYSFTTSGDSIADDPVAWRLEGSPNGSFWEVLDTQQRFPTPVERFREIMPQPFD